MSGAGNGSHGRGWLLMRRGGALWGLDNTAVESLTRVNGGLRIGLAGSALQIDEVVAVVPELAIRPVAPGLRRYWPAGTGGLALHAAVPVVVVDPHSPPCALRPDGAEPGERAGEGEGDGRDG